jgi:hypothetical protein
MDLASIGVNRGNGLTPCCSDTYNPDGSVKAYPTFTVSTTAPGMPIAEDVSPHFGHPITGHSGKGKKPMSWAKYAAE